MNQIAIMESKIEVLCKQLDDKDKELRAVKLAHAVEWAIERERLITDNESLRCHADNLRMQLRQETARLNHADEEIERLNKLNEKLRDIAKSFKEQTRKALAEQYKLSVRITEFENERKAKVI